MSGAQLQLAQFSPRQRQALLWWSAQEQPYDAVICDGAVRSGKTVAAGLGFLLWAMCRFQDRQFGICGKTSGAVRRNLLPELTRTLRQLGFQCVVKPSQGLMQVRCAGRSNTFLIFGGRDESAAALIQGVTLAGVLLDEVVLMPRSFVEQAIARCSVPGSLLWFTCNPAGKEHWFYRQWICQAEQRGALYLHFTMEDNPGLSEAVRARYRRMYSDVFYRRFVLGEWAGAEGRVYDFYDPAQAVPAPEEPMERYVISCDYGTRNPASFGLWGLRDGVWYRMREYYWDARKEGAQKTDQDYADALRALAGLRPVECVVIDPSAASFIELLRREGWRVRKARNEVLSGIRLTARLLRQGKLVLCRECRDCLREMELYVWDDAASGERVRKENDHAMDDMRYFAATMLGGEQGGFAAVSARRR